MAAEDKILKVLLKLVAETGDVAKVTAGLKEIEAQADKTQAALTGSSTTGRTGGQVDWKKLADERAAAVAQMNALDEKGIATAQARQAEEAKIALQMERRVIVETEIEAAEAKLAGNNAMAAKLEREAEIRLRALSIQRALNVTTEESILLAEKLVLAQEASVAPTAITGLNLNKAKAEAITLSRELATGSVNARTLGALLGSLGSTLTIAGLAGYELYQVIAHAADESIKITEEINRQTTDIAKQVSEWHVLASAAGDFGDVVKLGDKIAPSLTSLAEKLAEFRKKELSNWNQFIDLMSVAWNTKFSVSLKGVALSIPKGPYASALEGQKSQEASLAKQALTDAKIALETGRLAAEAWEKVKLEPLNQAVAEYTAKLQTLKSEQEAIIRAGDTEKDTAKQIELFKALVQKSDQIELTTKRLNELKKAEEREVVSDTTENERFRRQAVNDLLREQQTLLQGIRQQEELIQGDPKLSAEAKQEQLHNLYLREQVLILRQIAEVRALMAQLESVGDPKEQAHVQQLTQKLKQLQFEYEQRGQKAQGLTLGGGMQAELANWVNGFGTASHQIAQTIEGTINAALQGTNQLLLDSVFRTGDWQQTLVGVERQILNLFLTWIEQMALQKGAQLLGITTTTTAQVASGAAIAAAHAPAAAATSISSYGTAAIVGEVLAVAAIAAIIAALTGGFKKGGFTGEGDPNDPAGVVHKREYVHDAQTTERLGVQNLEALKRGDAHIAHYAEGGRAESHPGSSPNYRIGTYGPGVGEHTTSTNFGPLGKLREGDVAVSPNLIGKFPLGSYVVINGQTYRVADYSYYGAGRPTKDWVEIWTPPGGGNRDIGYAQVTAAGGRTTTATPTSAGDLFIKPTTTLRNDLPSDRIAALGGFRYIDLADLPADSRNTGLLYDWNMGQQEADLIARINASLGAQESDLIGSIQQNRDSVTYNADGSVTLVGGSGVGNPRLQTPWGLATPNDYSLGETIPTSGQDWTYGGNDAPIGSIVGSINGQPVVQTANGRQVVPGGSTSNSGGVSAYQRASDAQTAFQTGMMDAQSMAWERFARPDEIGYLGESESARGPLGRTPTLTRAQIAANSAAQLAYARIMGHNTGDQLAWSRAHPTAGSQQNALAGVWPGHADGVRLPGGPSMTDTIPAMLAEGEGVVPGAAMEWADKTYGRGWFDALLAKRQFHVPTLMMADGGRVKVAEHAPGTSGGSSPAKVQKQPQYIIVADIERAIERKLKTPQYESHIVSAQIKWSR